MITLAGRLYELRSGVGGSREKQRFEWSFGAPQELLAHITMPGPAVRRILGQLGFAVNLNEAGGGVYESKIGAALAVLEKSLAAHGVLVNDACAEAEQRLLPLSEEARQYTILCAAHAHIDMNWMWSWQETAASALATFRTMLDMMEAYPDFRFSQSQASVYRLVEAYDPDLMEEIKRRIQEGRWEVTASSWVETDKNMPCTESLLRHLRVTRAYLSSVWGVNPDSLNIDFSPDTFGHSAHIPEIDAAGGVRYLYHCRGLTERRVLYRWRAPSGAELLAHCEPYWYNAGIHADTALSVVETARLAGGLRTSLTVYGVGNHGGGPTRRDIERIIEMRDWPVFPQVRFGSFAEYFKAAETVRNELPAHTQEINFFATGCYTSQSRIKLGNRRAEAALVDAEGLDAAAALVAGGRYPPRTFEHAWEGVLFTHFHDIITGSCVRDTREYAMGLYSEAQAVAGAARGKATRAIAAAVDTSMIEADNAEGAQSEGAGVGYGLEQFQGAPAPERGRGRTRVYHVFNPSAHARNEVLEFTVWDWPYDTRRAELRDHAGALLPMHMLDDEPKRYWDHQYIRFLARVAVPASGYATVVFREAAHGPTYPFYTHPFPRSDAAHGPIILENAFLKAAFDPQTGALSSLIDKTSGEDALERGKSAGPALSFADKAESDAWWIGRYIGGAAPTPLRVRPLAENPLRSGLEIEATLLKSRIKTRITLDQDARALAYCFTIVWNEAAEDHAAIPVLRFILPLAHEPSIFRYDVPGGAIDRPSAPQDRPGLSYAAAIFGSKTGSGTAVSLSADSTYGYRGCGSELSATLINTSKAPDPFPERGEHSIRLWVSLSAPNPKTLIEEATDRCRGLSIVSGIPGRGGTLAPVNELLKLESAGAVLSSASLNRSGDLLLRLYDAGGAGGESAVVLPRPPVSASFVDLHDQEADGVLAIQGNTIRFEMPPYSLRTLKIRF
jgi:alpha-mannosidase